MRTVGAWVVLSLVLVTPARGGEGINLSWDDCGTAGSASRSFSSQTNAGLDVIVASFVPGPGVDQLIELIAKIDIILRQRLVL